MSDWQPHRAQGEFFEQDERPCDVPRAWAMGQPARQSWTDYLRPLFPRRRLHWQRRVLVTDLTCAFCGMIYPSYLQSHPTHCVVCRYGLSCRFQLMIWLPLRPIGMPR